MGVVTINAPSNISNENYLNVPNNIAPTTDYKVGDIIYDKTDCVTNLEVDNDNKVEYLINYDHDYLKEVEVEI